MNEEVKDRFDDGRNEKELSDTKGSEEIAGIDFEDIDVENADDKHVKVIKYAGIIAGAFALLVLGGSAMIFAQGAGCAGSVKAGLVKEGSAGQSCGFRSCGSQGGDVAATEGGGVAIGSGYAKQGAVESADCASGGGCCSSDIGNQAGNQALTGGVEKNTAARQIEKAAIEWYSAKFGDNRVTAAVQDFGCHKQVSIEKGQKTVRELIYRNGVFEVLPD